MPKEVVNVRGSKVCLDVLLLLAVGLPILFLFLWGSPFHRGVFCDDQSLIHPYHPSTVPSHYLYIVGIFINVIVIILIEYFNQLPNNTEFTFCGHKVPSWIYHSYNVVLLYTFGMLSQQLATNVMKYTVGRLRPHFLTVCAPNVCQYPNSLNKYWTDFTCTNQEFINNKRIMKEMRLSFPSGHSSFSMYTMLFLAIYLQTRMTWNGSILLRHTLQFLAVLFAIYTGMTRISDYKHHWSDVLIGFVVGTIGACVTALFLPDRKKINSYEPI